MPRSTLELFRFKVFGVQRSVWDYRFDAIRVVVLVVEVWSVHGSPGVRLDCFAATSSVSRGRCGNSYFDLWTLET